MTTGYDVRSLPDWIGYRHSLANVWRREQAGETDIQECRGCECEVDVPVPAHSPRCPVVSS